MGIDMCPCGRMEKSMLVWCCRCCYLEKEVGYALSELERGGVWQERAFKRLKSLVYWRD